MPNRAAVMTKLEHIEIQEIPEPEPGPTQAVVRIEAVGVCGSDTAYYKLGRIGDYVVDGPIVLVAHSYGGAVSSLAANGLANVKALVYLNALALDAGESNLGITERFPNAFGKALRPRPYPQGVDLYVDPARFRALFAADVPARITARMASAQRPVAAAAIEEQVTEPAWKTLPSWYLIGRQDEVISPAAQRFMAKRAKAHTVEIDSSHASYVSHPGAVTKLILRAVRGA